MIKKKVFHGLVKGDTTTVNEVEGDELGISLKSIDEVASIDEYDVNPIMSSIADITLIDLDRNLSNFLLDRKPMKSLKVRPPWNVEDLNMADNMVQVLYKNELYFEGEITYELIKADYFEKTLELSISPPTERLKKAKINQVGFVPNGKYSIQSIINHLLTPAFPGMSLQDVEIYHSWKFNAYRGNAAFPPPYSVSDIPFEDITLIPFGTYNKELPLIINFSEEIPFFRSSDILCIDALRRICDFFLAKLIILGARAIFIQYETILPLNSLNVNSLNLIKYEKESVYPITKRIQVNSIMGNYQNSYAVGDPAIEPIEIVKITSDFIHFARPTATGSKIMTNIQYNNIDGNYWIYQVKPSNSEFYYAYNLAVAKILFLYRNGYNLGAIHHFKVTGIHKIPVKIIFNNEIYLSFSFKLNLSKKESVFSCVKLPVPVAVPSESIYNNIVSEETQFLFPLSPSYYITNSGEVKNEDISAQIDSVNTDFYTKYLFTANSCEVFLNGMKLLPGGDYSEVLSSENSYISFNNAPLIGDVVIINYERQGDALQIF